MPSVEILTDLTAIANEWRSLAITWHVLLGLLCALVLAGWRPSTRSIGRLLIAPLASVSVVAWLSGNPFNGATFAVLGGVLIWAGTGFPNTSARLAGSASAASGIALVLFGWAYPHFLSTDAWTAYLYASPFGLLPCPTLSIAIGVTLLVDDLRSRTWSTTIALAGLAYGAVGVFRLGVDLDWALLLGSAMLTVVEVRGHFGRRSVRADRGERTRTLPGDSLIGEPLATLTHAITISRGPQAVWPWLIQMGAGNRAGWYSYDVFDNRRRPSATRLMPELENITIGTVFPALPGETRGFAVLAFDPCRSLILGWPGPDGDPIVTWAFVLEPRADGATRLIVRARGNQSYRFRGLPVWLSKPIARFVHFVMQRKQLLEIKRRVESSPFPEEAPAATPERLSA